MRTIGTFAAKAEADQALDRDPHRHRRVDPHALDKQVLATWIDAPIPVTTTSGRPRAIHLGIRTLASLTPAVAGMAQAVADELIAANPCAIKGAGQGAFRSVRRPDDPR